MSVGPIEISHARVAGRLNDLNLRVEPQECVVLVGPNGAGKSSLLRLLAGLLEPEEGRVELGGRQLSDISRIELSALVSWLPQRPALVPGLRTDELVALSRFRLGESGRRANAAARAALEKVGAGELIGRRTDQISGGELQRVLLATLAAQDAPLLLVDEPANHLDPGHQLRTYQLLGRMWREEKRTLLIVSHDVRLAAALGPREEIRVIGLGEGHVEFDLPFSHPTLHDRLEELFGVGFVPTGEQGELALQLPPWADEEGGARQEVQEPPNAAGPAREEGSR